MKFISVITTLSVVLFAMSCQKMEASRSSIEVTESEYFINGDPMEVIAGTKLNPNSFLTLDNYKEFDGFEVSGMMSFTQKSKRKDKNENDMEAVKKRNQTPTATIESKDTSSRFKSVDDRNLRLEVKSIPGTFLEFSESAADQRLNLTGVAMNDSRISVKPVHYSVNPEKTAFSVLFLMSDEDDSILMGFSYQKKTETSFVMKAVEAAKEFFYLFGKGVLIGQATTKPFKVQACGRNAEIYRSEINEGIAPWISPLMGRLEVQIEFASQCAPIFDVNHQTIIFLEDRITRSSKDVMNPASVLPRAATSQGLIVGSDMLIFKGEYKRMLKKHGRNDNIDEIPEIRQDIKISIMHEFGHMLGLGHPFESNADSIMGYDEKIKTITDFDIKSVQALYPFKTEPQKPVK